jgi:hypothetical protein
MENKHEATPPEMVTFDVDGHEIKLPRAAFEDGARVLSLSGETYVGTDWYRDSVRAFFWALKARGVKIILL